MSGKADMPLSNWTLSVNHTLSKVSQMIFAFGKSTTVHFFYQLHENICILTCFSFPFYMSSMKLTTLPKKLVLRRATTCLPLPPNNDVGLMEPIMTSYRFGDVFIHSSLRKGLF